MSYTTPLLGFLCTVTLSPLLLGVINRTKAVIAGRQGQPLLQTYYDIFKLLGKGVVYSRSTSWVLKANPLIGLVVVLGASLLFPIGTAAPLLSFSGDLFLFVYLFGIMRFFMIIAALDTASAFEGMGASREAFFSLLAEPVLLVGLATLARQSGSDSLVGVFGSSLPGSLIPALLVASSFFVVLLTENCRIPVDDPNTHLELTMIHEVMVLDVSGPDFALIQYSAAVKLWLFGGLVVQTLFPFAKLGGPAGFAAWLAAVFACAVLIGLVESSMARLRLYKVPQLLVGAGALAILAFIFAARGGVL